MKSWTKIWTEIAVAFDAPYSQRTGRQKYITRLGLCYALRAMGKSFYIPRYIVPTKYGYWWHTGERKHAGRATFAGLMAAMGNKGFTNFLKWCEKHD